MYILLPQIREKNTNKMLKGISKEAHDRRMTNVDHQPNFTKEPIMPAPPFNTIRLHRVLRAPPERVYRAFLNPEAMTKWLPPHGFTGKVHHMNAIVGGGYQMSFTNFGTGKSHSFSGKYIELKPYEQIRYIDQFDDPNMPGEMPVTILFRSVACGTELIIVQEGVPSAIPAELCYLGWQESLSQLACLVEPEIPDGM